MGHTQMKMKLLVGWLAVGLLVASACSDPDDSQVATRTETKPPAPVEGRRRMRRRIHRRRPRPSRLARQK